VPGIGCTINSMLDMNNVESTHGSTYDLAGLHRSKDPGSGAFTPYYNTHTTSVEHIPAGSEIFAAYGDVRKNDVVFLCVIYCVIFLGLGSRSLCMLPFYYCFRLGFPTFPEPKLPSTGIWKTPNDFCATIITDLFKTARKR